MLVSCHIFRLGDFCHTVVVVSPFTPTIPASLGMAVAIEVSKRKELRYF